eukprot:TRINITY_DN6158_c0_g1_i1.p1 TRINITY_DN6158_c0_g1~~TRINITY_DN6158_c0_g1_i1.p1  ORF type:complete len:449 (+),score=111.79 TRINITY_DN6158_c0_g1_i1:59-1348(+)
MSQGKFPEWISKYLGDVSQYAVFDVVGSNSWEPTYLTLTKFLGDEAKHQFHSVHGSRYDAWVDYLYVNEATGEKPKFKSWKEVKLSAGSGIFKGEFEGKTIFVYIRQVGDWVCGEDGFVYLEHASCFAKLSDFNDDRAAAMEYLAKFLIFVHTQEAQERKKPDFITILTWDSANSYYNQSGLKLKRSVASVFLPDDVKQKLLADVRRFLSQNSLKFYVNHGIPYRRSYLFYGKPGTGKTSMIQALASAFDRNIGIISLGSPDLTDEGLTKALSAENWYYGASVFVIEDIDAFFTKDRTTLVNDGALTFTGLLNALDGVNSSAGHLIIMTTNHPERLDAALIRNGRVDFSLEFPLSNHETVYKMFLSFYPDKTDEANKFADIVCDKFKDGVSMALLQQHFLRHMDSDAQTALEKANEEIEKTTFDFIKKQ